MVVFWLFQREDNFDSPGLWIGLTLFYTDMFDSPGFVDSFDSPGVVTALIHLVCDMSDSPSFVDRFYSPGLCTGLHILITILFWHCY